MGLGILSSTRTVVPATTPAPNQYWRGAFPAPIETTVYATPALSSIALRAMARQAGASAAVSAAARHLIHPQPPGTCLTSTYASRAQNTAPRAARLAPPSTGYAPLHTTAPTTHSMPPAVSPSSLHCRRGIRSARLMAVMSSSPRMPRYSLLAPATPRNAPQLTAYPEMTDPMT